MNQTLCVTCRRVLKGGNFGFRNGMYYCEKHYLDHFITNGNSQSSCSSNDFSLISTSEIPGPSIMDIKLPGNENSQARFKPERMIIPVTADVDDASFPLHEGTTQQVDPTGFAFPCGFCKENVEMGIRISGQQYHPECFRCVKCWKRIKLPKYGIANRNIYCSKDFIKILAKSEDVASVTGRNNPNIEKQNSDALQIFQTCESCGRKTCESLLLHGKFYHVDCFTCPLCGEQSGSSKFQIFDGRLICGKHYQKRHKTRIADMKARVPVSEVCIEKKAPRQFQAKTDNKSLCSACSKAVSVGLRVGENCFHPRCFRCINCMRKLDSTNYLTWNGGQYCRRKCCRKSFAKKLSRDPPTDLTSLSSGGTENKSNDLLQDVRIFPLCCECGLPTQEGFHINGTDIHQNCFKCHECKVKLWLKNYRRWDEKFYCIPHYRMNYRAEVRTRGAISTQAATVPNDV